MILGQFVSTIGNNFYILAVYWYVLELTHSHWDVLAIGLAQTLPAVGSSQRHHECSWCREVHGHHCPLPNQGDAGAILLKHSTTSSGII